MSAFLPRFNPGFAYQTAFQINPFVKYKGLEFFGVFEVSNNGDDDRGGSYTQLGAEVIYRFGSIEQLYLGGRYNSVRGKSSDNVSSMDIDRLNIGGGWYLTQNVLTKIEYVRQMYNGDDFDGSKFQGAKFDGTVIEAVISF